LAGKQNLDAAGEEVPSRRIVSADRVGAGTLTAAIEPCWKYAGVVEDQEIAGL
jgi:hypothetical protein